MSTHGIDIPDIETVFLARPTASPTLFAQMVGRAVRKSSSRVWSPLKPCPSPVTSMSGGADIDVTSLGDGKHALFTFLTFQHGHFGFGFLGLLRKLLPSPVQTNWRIHVRGFSVERVSADGLDGAAAVAALRHDVARDPQYLSDSILSRSCDFVSAVPRTEQLEGWGALRSALGIVDGFVVNGLDAAGLGVLNIVLVTKRMSVSMDERETISRVAAHLVAGLRIRQRLASADERLADADAVISPSGEVAHAVRKARLPELRESLRCAARALEKARGRKGGEDSSRAVQDWKVLVENRWSLLDHFERDGKRFMLACRNAPSAPPGELLTPRERQVVLLASRGHSNKLIGYELGIATSTVGVLLGRAAARLGVKSRRALIEQFNSIVS